MLILIGLGIYGWRGISLEGLEAARDADEVYLETYTSPSHINLGEVEEALGKNVTLVSRGFLEEGGELISRALERRVVLLCPGDPLIATTHIALILEARRRGIPTRIYHASSILTAAIGEAGLQVYKFSRMATLPFSRDFLPYSVYDALADNRERGLHTLLLLEYDVERGEFLSVKEALERLLEMEGNRGKGAISPEDTVIVLSGLGSEGEVKVAGRIKGVMEREFPPLPTVLIIPGSLHFLEEEAIKGIWVE